MAFWITSHMRTKRKQVDDKLVVIKLFAVIMQEIYYISLDINNDKKFTKRDLTKLYNKVC
jgi:hypothetical protein